MCLIKFVHFFIIFSQSVFGAITDNQYASMPPVFHFDDYDRCKLLGKDFLYCSLTFQLHPQNMSNASVIWNIIKEVSSNPKNYRHDILRHGVCIPETCSGIENTEKGSKILQGLNQCYNEKYEYAGLVGNVTKLYCEDQDSPFVVDAYDVVFALFLFMYTIFILFASLYEGIARYKPQEQYDRLTETTVGKILSAFSVPKNFHRLKHIDYTRPDVRSLSCIQGIRFYNMVCVVLAHTLMVQFGAPVSNPIYTETVTDQLLNAFITNGGYVVQTFLLISGWLLTYNMFKTFGGKRELRFSHLAFIFVNRCVRLVPTLAFVIAFHSTWIVHFARGPFWNKLIGEEYRNCRRNWWTNILFVNNYVRKEEMCLQQTWYLATDTQLYLVSLLVIFLMKKTERIRKLIMATMLVLGIAIPATIAYVNNYDILVRQFPEPLYDILLSVPQWHAMYSSSHSNIGGYAIGIIFGYLFYKTKARNIFTSKARVTAWWILSFGLPISMVLIAGKMYDEDYTFTRLESALYWGFGKNVFGFGVAVGILGMTQNVGWFVPWFCRWPPAQVLGRLTFSAYLVHVGLIKVRAGMNHQPLYSANHLFLHACLGDVTLAYLVATVVTLTIEMPISALQKMVVRQEKY